MAIIDIKTPTKDELKYAGLLIVTVFFIIGGIVYWQTGSHSTLLLILGTGAVIGVLYYMIPVSRMFIYYGWMKLISPVGLVMSHVIFAITYFLVLTPTGLLMRLLRYDPLTRRLKPDAESYWIQHRTGENPVRYFNQY